MGRRLPAFLLVGALTLSACTDDGAEDAAPSEAPTSSESVSATDEPTEPTESPSQTESPSADDEPSSDPSPTTSESDGPEQPQQATPSPTDGPTAAVTSVPGSPTSEDAEGTVFAADRTRTRARLANDTCPVAAVEGEEIVDCTFGFSRSNGDRQTAVVASRIDGVDTLTVYDAGDGGGWQSSLVADVTDLEQNTFQGVRRTPWAGGDDAFVVDFAFSQELVMTDAPSGSRVVAVLADGLGGLSNDYVAGRVVIRFQELGPTSLRILEPTADGLVGTRFDAGEDAQQIPEDVALRVYRAWVTGDPASAADLATPEVISALQAAPQQADAFTMVGTRCPVEAGAAICRFRGANDTELTWEVRDVDGTPTVTRLR